MSKQTDKSGGSGAPRSSGRVGEASQTPQGTPKNPPAPSNLAPLTPKPSSPKK